MSNKHKRHFSSKINIFKNGKISWKSRHIFQFKCEKLNLIQINIFSRRIIIFKTRTQFRNLVTSKFHKN